MNLQANGTQSLKIFNNKFLKRFNAKVSVPRSDNDCDFLQNDPVRIAENKTHREQD